MKIVALFCAAVAVCLPAFALSATSRDPVSVAHYPNVKQVDCILGKGTAFNTVKGWLSVNHVTSLSGCRIDGHDITAESETGLDFSRVTYSGDAPKLPINCEGFRPGHWYFAIGFAGGFSWQTMTRILATYKDTDDGFRILLGSPTVIPGMSGGPILNEAGEVVGTINMYSKIAPLSYSRALKDTSLCGGRHA